MGQNIGFRGYFEVQTTFLPASTCQHPPTTKLSEKVYLGVLQHPTKFQAKIDRKNLFVKKIKIFTRWLRILGVYFGHNSPTP